MSYCRFSNKTYKPFPKEIPNWTIPKSDLYVFESSGGLECCGCRLPDYKNKSFVTCSYSEMIDHIKKHINYGHTVPKYLIPMLEEEMNNEEVE